MSVTNMATWLGTVDCGVLRWQKLKATRMSEPTLSPILSSASWEEAWTIIKALQYTGPVTVQCGQGVPSEVTIPGPITRIRLDKQSRKRQT
jgi:hypothetical protein